MATSTALSHPDTLLSSPRLSFIHQNCPSSKIEAHRQRQGAVEVLAIPTLRYPAQINCQCNLQILPVLSIKSSQSFPFSLENLQERSPPLPECHFYSPPSFHASHVYQRSIYACILSLSRLKIYNMALFRENSPKRSFQIPRSHAGTSNLVSRRLNTSLAPTGTLPPKSPNRVHNLVSACSCSDEEINIFVLVFPMANQHVILQ